MPAPLPRGLKPPDRPDNRQVGSDSPTGASQFASRMFTKHRSKTMSTITTKDGTEIFYKDWGPKSAQSIVFHHGWPLSGDDWDTQMLYFLAKAYRVVAH